MINNIVFIAYAVMLCSLGGYFVEAGELMLASFFIVWGFITIPFLERKLEINND